MKYLSIFSFDTKLEKYDERVQARARAPDVVRSRSHERMIIEVNILLHENNLVPSEDCQRGRGQSHKSKYSVREHC